MTHKTVSGQGESRQGDKKKHVYSKKNLVPLFCSLFVIFRVHILLDFRFRVSVGVCVCVRSS